MRTKLLILLFLASLTSYAQYTLIPDANFENKLIELGIDKDGRNGKVATTSINSITTLDISWSEISDLTGIQNFISLTSLDCKLNNLTTLDLTYNNKLGILDCRGNKLTSLDLSKLPLLTGVMCSENFLTSLDVSKNPILAGVFCSKNNLISLNVKNGNNSKFQTFFCNFKDNPLLSCIQVDNPTYSNSNWADFKDNTTIYSNSCGPSYTTIPDPNFENKLISLGIDTDGKNGKVLTSRIISLSTLDVSNSSITDITGLQNFLSLITLNVSNNQLTNLNLIPFTKIKNLDCSNNLLKDLDITENKKLEVLNFSTNQLSTIELSFNPLLSTINAASNAFTYINISGLEALKSLDVNNNQLTGLGASNNTVFSQLKCSNNLLPSLKISEFSSLISLYCGNNKIENLDITTNLLLREISCENNKLTSLKLKNGKNNLFTIVDFRNNSSLQCIEVDDENYSVTNWSSKKDATTNFNLNCGPFTLIPDPKFEDKLIALGIDKDGKNGKTTTASISNISSLDLSNSSISNLKGIEDFANLQNLNISGNQLILLDVSKNNTLQKLNCSLNLIEDLDFSMNLYLTDLYCNNNNLKTLNLKNGSNSKIKNIDIRNNPTLGCIQIDNQYYSNQYWSAQKDATSSFELFCGAYTAIPDYFFEKRLIELGIDIDGSNGKVFTAHIYNLNSLNINQSGISNLTGIQDFKNLTLLNCSKNSIENLNLSQNTALVTLDFSDNPIAVLDLSKNSLLKNLDCHSSALRKLDITPIVSLETLDCSDNKIQILDITRNLALTSLICFKNQLPSLILTENTYLKYLDCSGNKFTTLDVSHNVALNSFLCNQNLITELNLSNNTALTKLECSVNSLTNIDLSNNALLTSLSCFTNKLTSANIKNGNNTKLTIFDIADNPDLFCIQVDSKTYFDNTGRYSKDKQASFSEDCNKYTLITDENFENKLIELGIDKDGKNGKTQTAQIADIQELDLSELNILDLNGIEDFIMLTKLNCSSNTITQLDLTKNVLLVEIDCSKNKITNLDCSKNTVLSSLDCSHNDLITLNLENGNNFNLAQYDQKTSNFSYNPNLYCINVDNIDYSNQNMLGLKDRKAIYSRSCGLYADIQDSNLEKRLIELGIDKDGLNGKILKTDAMLVTDLDVSEKEISDLSVLEFFTSLKNLNCSENDITQLNLFQNTALTDLNCSNTFITNLDLSKNKNLINLNCINNKLALFSIKNGSNKAIKSINLKNNPDLTCIEVDDATYSNSNWSNFKDEITDFSISCNNYTSIPDDNFEYKLIALGIDTDGKNGKVITENISKITTLEISFSKIADLTGIQDFKSLKYLSCYGNLLKTVDLSANTALADINFTANKLEKLDLSKNINLYNLECRYNQLTQLDLPNNTILDWIDCDYNQLTQLNILPYKKLRSLDCTHNKLTVLEIPKETNLIWISCNNNELTNLDVSNIGSLKAINCSENLLETINVFNNPLLEWIDCSNNNLTSLNLSNNSRLFGLDVNKNKLTSLNLSDCPILIELNGNQNKLNTLDLSKNTYLKNLSIDDNELSSIDLSKNRKLETFNCRNNKLYTVIDCGNNLVLSTLNCSNNQLKSISLKIDPNNFKRPFSGDFTNNPDLNCVGVDDEDYANTYWYIQKDPSVSFSENCPPFYISISIEFEKKLISLGIDTDGPNGKILSSEINNITILDISNSGISDIAGIEFFTSLEKLICKDNSISTINLSSNTSLNYLDSSRNPLTTLNVSNNKLLTELYCDGEVTVIQKSMASSSQLTTLDLSNNTLLTKLSCSNNKLTTLDLSKNNQLTVINCSNNKLTNLDLSKNNQLTTINCSNNNLTDLNLNNKNNTLISTANFKNNASLSCIKVDYPPYFIVKFANTKDDTATYSATCNTLGIEESVFDKISIYPNPTKGELHITNIVLEKITVYDALGKLIKTVINTSGTKDNTIDLKGFPSGIYYIFLQSDGANTARKIIVE
jgi:Leucine-rich repeat (LRR) protein